MFYTVQSDEEQLEDVVARFYNQAFIAQKLYEALNNRLEVIRGGAWIGPNANRFCAHMTDELVPALMRLEKAMHAAGDTVKQVQKIIRDADEQNKSYFPT
jgi:WXG100 family type VII secretion target